MDEELQMNLNHHSLLPNDADVEQVVIDHKRFVKWKNDNTPYWAPNWVWQLVAEGELRGMLVAKEESTKEKV